MCDFVSFVVGEFKTLPNQVNLRANFRGCQNPRRAAPVAVSAMVTLPEDGDPLGHFGVLTRPAAQHMLDLQTSPWAKGTFGLGNA